MMKKTYTFIYTKYILKLGDSKMKYIVTQKVKLRQGSADGYYEVTVPKIAEEVFNKGDLLTPVICTNSGAIIYLPKGVDIVPEKMDEAIVKEEEEG